MAIINYDLGTNANGALDDTTGVLTITGTGAMTDFTPGASPLYNNRVIQIIIIESGITKIGDYVFQYCMEVNSVTIPDSVDTIGIGAFYACMTLTSIVNKYNGNQTINANAFAGVPIGTSYSYPINTNFINAIHSGSDVRHLPTVARIRLPEGVKNLATEDYVDENRVSSAITMTTGTGTVDTRITDIEIGKISMLSDDTSPALGGNLSASNYNINFTEFDNGNSGTSKTIDWTKSNMQKLTLTGNCAVAFTDPPGACNLLLRLVQDATGGRTVTWPTIKTPEGNGIVISSSAGAIDIVSLYFDGTSYYGQVGLNFV